MSQISPYGIADNGGLSLKVRELSLQTMGFQTDKGTDRQTNMVALRDFKSKLPTFNPGELLQPRW